MSDSSLDDFLKNHAEKVKQIQEEEENRLGGNSILKVVEGKLTEDRKKAFGKEFDKLLESTIRPTMFLINESFAKYGHELIKHYEDVWTKGINNHSLLINSSNKYFYRCDGWEFDLKGLFNNHSRLTIAIGGNYNNVEFYIHYYEKKGYIDYKVQTEEKEIEKIYEMSEITQKLIEDTIKEVLSKAI